MATEHESIGNRIPARTLSPTELKWAERKAKWTWGAFIIFMLGLQVAGGVTAIVLASGDPSVAIVPNYHKAALNWDMTHRQRQMIESLGWKVDVAINAQPIATDEKGGLGLEANVVDPLGNPVEGLRILAKVYHHARGTEVDTLSMSELNPGVYSANTAFIRGGTYQVDMRVEGPHGIAAVSRTVEVEANDGDPHPIRSDR